MLFEVLSKVPKSVEWVIGETWVMTSPAFAQDRPHVVLMRDRRVRNVILDKSEALPEVQF